MADLLELLEAPGQAIIITAGSPEADRDELFERVCEMYPEARIEMDAAGNIIMVPGNSEDSAYRSGEAFGQLAAWARRDGTGRALDCSATFNLPNGAKRSPDAAWVSKEILKREGPATKKATKTRHVPLFLIEVASPSDRLSEQQDKCREWVTNGVSEAILLDPKTKTAYVFRPLSDTITLPNATQVASTVLNGFVLECGPIWEALA
jgi:Uma2 family endonuclease